MRFESEEHAREYWDGLKHYYGIDNEELVFRDWVEDNNVSWLDSDMETFMKSKFEVRTEKEIMYERIMKLEETLLDMQKEILRLTKKKSDSDWEAI